MASMARHDLQSRPPLADYRGAGTVSARSAREADVSSRHGPPAARTVPLRGLSLPRALCLPGYRLHSIPVTSIVSRIAGRVRRSTQSPVQLARSRGAAIGDDVVLARGSVLGERFTMGDHSHASGPLEVAGTGSAVIGKWAAIGTGLRIITSNHDPRFANMHIPLQRGLGLPDHNIAGPPVVVGHATWLGDRVTMISGAAVGHGAVIGAGSLVRSSIPAFAIAAGVPARVIRQRFADEVVEVLLEVAWWDWSLARIHRNRTFFGLDCSMASVEEIRDSIQL